MPTVVIIAGSISDSEHSSVIINELSSLKEKGWELKSLVLSAHKNTKELLDVLNTCNNRGETIFITVAGLSNALSGVVACNTKYPVFACPPYKSTEDYMVDIHSTLRMPSNAPVMTVISPKNCALAVLRLVDLYNWGKARGGGFQND
jgi:5-(carboxyamino)imidazole ribonucleotide mutase